MTIRRPAQPKHSSDSKLVAVLGPTNTGKTHLAIERLCAHSSGAIGFPLRLLAREVYERVCAIKGVANVALITGEERIEPKGARWLLCTVEAMPVHADIAFMAIDEVQLCADRERGHIFTDRLLHARGREETMLLGSATMQPMVRALLPEAEIISRPRFSTLSHAGARKLSRIPPRSAIVAFSAEQVYAVAELLRRFRGGAAVVMGALSPETRNKQVALYQSGEVDYLVATDAIGMGLNLDVSHVAFAGLSKFDGQRQRRLTSSEMAQIAGRAGRHQRDGTFGTLSGSKGHDAEFSAEEIYAIEEHRFPPLTRIFWRASDPRLDSLELLIDDLSEPPKRPELAPAPEAIDLAVMRRLAEDPELAASVSGRGAVARFREACMLPDFRQQGAEAHSRFVARLWEDLRHGAIANDFIAARIAELDNPSGDIDTLQGRIAAIRSWAYIAQRPDWVVARDEMAARARAVEARLSDALHSRLTERFVNRRVTILMKGAGVDAALLPVAIRGDNILVDGEPIGKLEGFLFKVDPQAHHDDHKLLFAAAEKHLPHILAERAINLADEIAAGTAVLQLSHAAIMLGAERLARLSPGRTLLAPVLALDQALGAIPPSERGLLKVALTAWLEQRLQALKHLSRLDTASRDEAAGPELRALLIKMVDGGGVTLRAGSGIESLHPEQRVELKRLGVKIGGLDLFLPRMIRPAAQAVLHELFLVRGQIKAAVPDCTPASVARNNRISPHGYRQAGQQALRVDLVERVLVAAHDQRTRVGRRPFTIDETRALSMGLVSDSVFRLLIDGGFKPRPGRKLAEGEFGPATPTFWTWVPPLTQARKDEVTRSKKFQHQREARRRSEPEPGAFAGLADLLRPKHRTEEN